jgi:N-acetylneuraminate synthase
LASIPLRASILEKHFISDKSWPGPDITISINPSEIKELIHGSEAIFHSLGGTKNI